MNNNPYKYTDPDGEFANAVLGAGLGALASGLSAWVSGADTQGIVTAAVGGAVTGALTGGLNAVKSAGQILSAVGVKATTSAAVATTSTAAITGIVGNSVGQGTNMAINAATGADTGSFDGAQALGAGGIAAVGAIVPSVIAAGGMVPVSLSPLTYGAIADMSALSAGAQTSLAVLSGVTEGVASQAIKANAYVNN